MRRFCDTEAFGTEFQAGCLSPEDNRALAIMKEKTRKLDIGYEVPIIWKEEEPNLINNRQLAENRLKRLCLSSSRPGFCQIFPCAPRSVQGPKLRVVFDAAARFIRKSLNDAIVSGPALQPALATVLSRFRQDETSDIEAMFSRFRLTAEDANYFCFLWQDKETHEPVVCRMDRLPFGASCSPFVAIHTVRQIVRDAGVEERIITATRDQMYVDDYLGSAPSVPAALGEALVVKTALANVDLNLQRWISNSREFMLGISTDIPEDQPSTHPLIGGADEKVLGVVWNTRSDTIGFKVADPPDTDFTRVALVSHVAFVFDPLGTASPLIVKAKIRLRELGLKGLDWMDVVIDDDHIWWSRWFEALSQLNAVEMPRSLFPRRLNILTSELHTFCDASEEAYATVIYIHNTDSDGQIIVRQARAANKLVPKKVISVPKLELNAALLGSRLTVALQTALTIKIHRRRFWTDSSTVRNWIPSAAAHYQDFVGIFNPADAATRSTLNGEVFPPTWLTGPSFLGRPEEDWPVDLPWTAITEEIRTSRAYHTAVQEVKFDWSDVEVKPGDVATLTRMSTKFFDLVKRCQNEVYTEELKRVKKGKPLPSTSSLLALAPILDADGILRLGGRAGRAKLPYDQLHSPLHPGKHPFSEKIIRAFHEHLKHVGTDFLLA
ncbi:uncharacterized protein LOC130703053 [Daphnia carinata]|uniref:uncharacterized protein LOC130703053 n=1 Tax=Daphnia carinata TaxID=120202 RepID=UPI00257CAF97|nr:uncharacterized protein LOC130703053 [Daphnia carinata]